MKKFMSAVLLFLSLNVSAQFYNPPVRFYMSPSFMDVQIFNIYNVNLACNGWATIQNFQYRRIYQVFFSNRILANSVGFNTTYLGPVGGYYSSVINYTINCMPF